MSVLTDALTMRLGSRIRVNSPARGISRSGGLFTLHMEDGSSDDFDSLVLAAPAYAQAGILGDLAPGIAELLGGIPYPPVAVVCLGYREDKAGHCMDGFGFLVPSRENRGILGTVADSNVFPGRAPDGSVLFRAMVGGARSPQLAELPDEQMLNRVLSDLRDILGLDADPDFVSIYRHRKAIPQYLVGHAANLAVIDRQLEAFPGLVLTGNAFRGVSLNDCVLNASRIAEQLVGKAEVA
jgi:oxygen-dependent protoporphyrinogen oxidase